MFEICVGVLTSRPAGWSASSVGEPSCSPAMEVLRVLADFSLLHFDFAILRCYADWWEEKGGGRRAFSQSETPLVPPP